MFPRNVVSDIRARTWIHKRTDHLCLQALYEIYHIATTSLFLSEIFEILAPCKKVCDPYMPCNILKKYYIRMLTFQFHFVPKSCVKFNQYQSVSDT